MAMVVRFTLRRQRPSFHQLDLAELVTVTLAMTLPMPLATTLPMPLATTLPMSLPILGDDLDDYLTDILADVLGDDLPVDHVSIPVLDQADTSHWLQGAKLIEDGIIWAVKMRF